jgi:hypothetical protein
MPELAFIQELAGGEDVLISAAVMALVSPFTPAV